MFFTKTTNNKHKKSAAKRPQQLIMQLEPRIMFDAAAVVTADLVVDTIQVADSPDTAYDTGADKPAYHDLFSPDLQAATTDQPLFGLPDILQTDTSAPSGIVGASTAAQESVRSFLEGKTAADLFAFFNGQQQTPSEQWLATAEKLIGDIQSGSLTIKVELLDDTTMKGALGAFATNSPEGAPVIFLNRDWATTVADTPEVTRVLVEELGHSIDHLLNPGTDTTGDEGRQFALQVLPELGSASALGYDHDTLVIDGRQVEVELATYQFSTSYAMVYDLDNDGSIDNNERWAAKEQNSHYFNSNSLGVAIIDDSNYNNKYFSGNDVSAIGLNIGGQNYYGWISRPIKANGVVRGFYFWTDNDFTNLALAQADGNQDGDGNVADNRGFLLVVDPGWFAGQITATGEIRVINNVKDGNLGTITVANVGSSSDRVDSALNALVDANAAPVAVADTGTATEAGGVNNGTPGTDITYASSTSVLANDTDADGNTLTVIKITNTTAASDTVTSTTPGTVTGRYGTLSIKADGTYSYEVANGNAAVDALQLGSSLNDIFTYTVSDGKGGTTTATLTITISGSNDHPTANPDYNTAKESTTVGGSGFAYTGYSASGNVVLNDIDVDDGTATKTIDGIITPAIKYSNYAAYVTQRCSKNFLTLLGLF